VTVLSGARVIAIVRLPAPGVVVRVGQELADAGLLALEVTLTTPAALDAITALRADLGDGCAVGAGSVRTPADVAAAHDAGARFLVTPTTSVEVLTEAARHRLPMVCGALTPTEIDTAWSAGASLVKLFPASLGGPTYLREVRAPLPDVPLVPTGGVTPDSLQAWAAAGAVAVGAGSALVNTAEVAAGDWAALRGRSKAFMSAAEVAPWRTT
jgi:2-dehydro-3-deoxyphosphogluconate aldolase/(4S)-4-hydroxy-2-oxoglutarate aldolase